MAAVTEEIISNLIKTNLKNLKSFAELLNAEFTEEGRDEANRDKYKDDVSRILNKFAKAEANFQKSIQCLAQTKNEVYTNIAITGEDCNRETLMKDIDEIINTIEGKSRLATEEPLMDVTAPGGHETEVIQWLEKVEDIMNEFHPLKFRDDDDEDEDEEYNEHNEHEEQKLNKILEEFQKKSMKKLEQSMMEDKEENAMDVDSETSDEDENETVLASQQPGTSNEQEKREMDNKLKRMWKKYENQISQVTTNTDLQQIFKQKQEQMTDVNFNSLTHYPTFNKSILELFSREAIVVLAEKQNYVDPISKKEILMPLRNTKCGHIYDKETILNIFKKRKEFQCPFLGCSCRSFTVNDLEEDEDLTQKVTDNLNRKTAETSTSAIGNNSFAEYLDSD